MDELARRRKTWKLLVALISGWLKKKFAFTPERCGLEGASLVISNHVTNWDPLLLALSFPDDQMFFVASEHIFRLGIVSKIIRALVDPIARSKAGSGADTVRACLKRLRAGASVCLFAEGDCTWDGRSKEVFPATGKLAKSSGAALITYRIEGGYLTLPRWGRGVRRGKMSGHIVNRYSAERLRSMSAAEVDEAINRDIYEDAWVRQRRERTAYRGAKRAENLETALFICPECGSIGGLASRGDTISCKCGLSRRINEYGYFEPAEPFESVAEWDLWQREKLAELDIAHGELFRDSGVKLSSVGAGHTQETLGEGELLLSGGELRCGAHGFALTEITDISMVKTKILLFRWRGGYYELRAGDRCCLRKYLLAWQCLGKKD